MTSNFTREPNGRRQRPVSHTQDQKTLNRRLTTRRLGRVKVTLAKLKCQDDENHDE